MARGLATRIVAGLAAALVILAAAVAARAEIGVAAVVDNQVSGTREGETRPLAVGDGVAQDEIVATGAESGAHLLFVDRTSLTLGENAQVALTTFVYDPEGDSEVVATAAQGAFRFISGLGGPNTYVVETPRVTMGIRGSIVESIIDRERMIELHVVVQGSVTITAGDQTVTIDEPGGFVVVTATGTIVGPAVWRGPILDLTALTDFYAANVAGLLEGGGDLLELLDAENFNQGRDAERGSEPPAPTTPYDPGAGVFSTD